MWGAKSWLGAPPSLNGGLDRERNCSLTAQQSRGPNQKRQRNLRAVVLWGGRTISDRGCESRGGACCICRTSVQSCVKWTREVLSVLSIILPIPSLRWDLSHLSKHRGGWIGEEERPEDWRRQCQGFNYPLPWGKAGPIKVCKLAPQCMGWRRR